LVACVGDLVRRSTVAREVLAAQPGLAAEEALTIPPAAPAALGTSLRLGAPA